MKNVKNVVTILVNVVARDIEVNIFVRTVIQKRGKMKINIIISVDKKEHKDLADYFNLDYPMSFSDRRRELDKILKDFISNCGRK